jgi:hypothetical protein
VRDARGAARLENGEAPGHEDLTAARIRDAYALTPADVLPDRARRQHQRDGPEIAPEDRAGHLSQYLPLRRARKPGLADHRLHEAGLARPPADFLARGGEAEQRQDRHEQEPAVDRAREPRIPGAEPQPEVQPDAAVDPGHGEDDDLAQARDRIELPEREHHERVGRLRPGHLVRQSGAHHVPHEEGRHQQSQGKLARFPRRHAERAPPVEGPQGEQIVDAERAVEGDGARQAAPDEDEPVLPRRHGLERDEPERVVEEVGREVGEEHEARPEADLPDDGRR